MRFDDPYVTVACLSMHGILSISSLIFRVPAKRHEGIPMIYKEYQQHSIIFGMRGVASAIASYYELPIIVNIVIVNMTMICADIATRRAANKTSTMRQMPYGNFDISEHEKDTIT